MSRVEYTVEEQAAMGAADALESIANELEHLNDHLLAYLKVMALNLLTPCGPSDQEGAQKAREASALELLKHVEDAMGS